MPTKKPLLTKMAVVHLGRGNTKRPWFWSVDLGPVHALAYGRFDTWIEAERNAMEWARCYGVSVSQVLVSGRVLSRRERDAASPPGRKDTD